MPKIGLTKISAEITSDKNSKEQLSEFKNISKSSDEKVFSFQGVVPIPEGIDNSEEDVKYDWYILNWGTNCDAINPIVTEDSMEKVSYQFYSAWSPPQKFVINASRKFPNLKFTFSYEMNYLGQKGSQEVKNGKVVNSDGNGIFLDDHSMKLVLLQLHNMRAKTEDPDLRL